MDPPAQRLETLESIRKIQWPWCWRENKEMVVGRKQMVDTECKGTAGRHQIGEEHFRSGLTNDAVLSRRIFERCARLK